MSPRALAPILALSFAISACRASGEPPPNVVLIFVDDLGWGDLGCYGGALVPTPNLDRLAREGARFSDFYAPQPVCSASRAALLTGRYAERTGVTGALGPGAANPLPQSEVTLAELCRSRGYATALFGKWHLGDRPESLPLAHGFDEFFGIPYSSDMWPFHPETPAAYPPLPLYEGRQVVATNPDPSRYTSELTARACAFVRAHARDPFFLYLPNPLPHVPLGKRSYADVLAEIDASTGEITRTLEELGIARRTLLVFSSDNGPWLSYGDHAGSSGGLAEGKGTTFEGGVRVPCIAWMPGTIPAGTVIGEPAMSIDLLPTVAELAGAELPACTIDGRSLLARLRGNGAGAPLHEALFFSFEPEGLQALRSGRWKLHLPHSYRSMEGRTPGAGGQPGKYDMSRRIGCALFDLEADPGETHDVSAEHPDVVAKLRALAEAHRADLAGKTGP